jgi:hypothetical protein
MQHHPRRAVAQTAELGGLCSSIRPVLSGHWGTRTGRGGQGLRDVTLEVFQGASGVVLPDQMMPR